MVPNQREFEVVLPVGYIDPQGRTHRRAVIRKMRGHEEALLYDPALVGGRLVTELIRSCLARLGDLEVIDSEVVAQLYTADRNFLLLEIRRVTLGTRLQTSYACPRCGVELSVVEDLSELEVRRLGDDERPDQIKVLLEDGYTDRAGTTHRELTLSLPKGSDEEFVTPMIRKDPLKAQEALLLRCIRQFGTLAKASLEAYGVKILRDLTLGDRQRIQAALNHEAPGVRLQRSVQCGPCGAVFEGVMDTTHFFVLG
jgi:hypothetical protein